MSFLEDVSLLPVVLLLFVGSFALFDLFFYLFIHPFSRYPGPFLAKFTDVWRYMSANSGETQKHMIALHEKYGPIVRTGPTTLSISDPAYIPRIYGIGHGFHKGAFYNALTQPVNRKPGLNLFTTQNPDHHATLKKPVANAYAMSTLTEFEPFVDRCIVKFMKRLQEEFVAEGKACNMADWLQYYAFDVIAELTLGEPFGFLDQGIDVHDMMQALEDRLDRDAASSHMPWMDWVIKTNPIINYFGEQSSKFASFSAELVKKRIAQLQALKEKGVDPGPRNFIDRFLEAQRANPTVIDDRQVVVYTTTNIVAGSDTTAISLRAIIYFLLKYPEALLKLTRELQEAKLSFPVTWKESQGLPYLSAVVHESLRLHPAVGYGLERVVPAKGFQMDDGTILPGGSQVGMNAWVVHLEPVFGTDPKMFRPERWLQGEQEDEEMFKARIAAMRRADLTFGHGSRTCIGKNISYLEIYKLIPSLLRKFGLDLVRDPEKEWKTKNKWFVRQWDMDCYVSER